MNWSEFRLARLLMAEEKIGSRLRAHDQAGLAQDAAGRAELEARGLVTDGAG